MSIESGELLRQENSRKIIAALQQLLIEDNATDISMANLADKAGVARKTIFNIFSSKNNLIICAAISAYTDLHAALDARCESDGFHALPGMDQVVELHVARARFHDAYPYIIRLISEIERLKLTEETEIKNFKTYFELVDSVTEYYDAPLKKGKADGSIKNDLDYEEIHSILFFSFGAVSQKLKILHTNELMRDKIDTFGIMRTLLKETRMLLGK